MEGEGKALSAEQSVRQNLQQRLLDGVKQCQIHFGARQEMATETDLRVATLCVEWEAVLLHGVKRNRTKAPLKQIAGLVKTEVSLWPLAQVCLSPEEVQRFLRLSHVTSDIGRGRAWLRAAINERTLENYLHLILANESRVRLLYDPHAFLLDQERSSILPVMAAGLCSILFSIPVDADYLNTPSRSVDVTIMATPLSVGHAPSTTSALLEVQSKHNGPQADSVVAVSRKKRRKRLSVPNGRTPSPSQDRRTPSETASDSAQEEVTAISSEVGIADSKSDVPVNSKVGVADSGVEGVASLGVGGATGDRGSSENLSSSPSLASVTSELEAGTPKFVALDAALLGNQSSSEAEAEAAASATAMVLSATLSSSSSSLPLPTGPPVAPQGVQAAHTLSPEDLREALLAMVKTKDELEEANRQLMTQLQEVRSQRDQLAAELSLSRTELISLHTSQPSQQALERENDLLKEQLKLMVQRRDTSLHSTENSFVHGLEETPPTDPQATPTLPHPHSRSSTDEKLSEMADMYGEIMEHNDRLQRDMAHKDGYITRLINTIQEAGLQVPTLVTKPHSVAVEQDGNKSTFVNVWIPSVIKRGRGPDAHHIYQVFVRVRDQEWNVYRRYAEFREFHKQLQQCIPEVNSFQFPPKKALGNKSVQLVEERRQRLQDYLRLVVRLCTEPRSVQGKRRRHQLDPIMKPDIDRDTLQDILPFFREDMHGTATASQSLRLSYSGL